MKERENYMLCSDCGYAFKQSQLFIRKFHNTAICLCKKCAVNLCKEIADYKRERSLEKLKEDKRNDR